jgi:predicted enzyme related to lactoylglutathione lyase
VKIILNSVMVADQDKALAFYTDKLGFTKKTEIPMGDFKWLTVVSPEVNDNVELLLEPLNFAPAKIFQQALFDAGIPATAFGVDDIDKEYERLNKLGVTFKMKPTDMGPVIAATLDDTCGNYIQIVERK